ncbi:hypothetical protein DMA12_02545 [Amycolatopsis balhimycina DSM 5908]|uniref:Uncharacterized protein n=1 Tax=Amycolatopsis balhimycina DSM 5908 TaxID=1081091 RepID=A0A428X4H6_AMYBA|nr:hypothetical protein [Amycolatopsis balhimycina]RSM50147.1 hypothetical protein DMA12_02545 [Amycolatopsis balhimycina DSM 5908]
MAEQRDDGKPGSDIERAGSGAPAAGNGQPGNAPTPGQGSPVLPQPSAAPVPVRGTPALPQPSGAPAQPPVDPAELEQFRQFQQFQDYLRFTQAQQGNQPASAPDAGVVQAPAPQQGGQPPMIPPGYQLVPAERRRAPKWVTWLGKKVIAWVLAIVILAIAGTWLYNHFFPNDSGKTSAQLAQEGGGKYHTNHVFSTNPYEAVRMVYHNVAQGRVDDACGRFQNEGQRDIQTQFAQDIAQTFRQNAAQTDCKKAVEFLATQVTNKNDYAESLPSSVSEPLPGDTVTIDSCTFAVKGGPALGVFTVSKVEKGQWLITGHAIGPAKCSGVPATATPTS